jgi:hypothetical protein
MVALFFTETSTTNGLQAVFLEEGRLTIFILSTIWSMISICRTFVSIKTDVKSGPIPVGGQLVLMFRALFSVGTRIVCIILYLTPFLGLFNIHYHFVAEGFPYMPTEMMGIDWLETDYEYLHENKIGAKISSVPFSTLFRSDYDTEPPTPTTYTMYTAGITLQIAYIILMSVLLINAAIIWISKLLTSEDFKAAPMRQKIRHTFQTLNQSDIYQDWDEGDTRFAIPAYRDRWARVNREMLVAIVLHWALNMVLQDLLPLYVTGNTWCHPL